MSGRYGSALFIVAGGIALLIYHPLAVRRWKSRANSGKIDAYEAYLERPNKAEIAIGVLALIIGVVLTLLT